MIFAITGGLADVLSMARPLDILPGDAAGMFSKFKVGSVIPMRAEKMAKGDLSATFELTMARKDIRLMIRSGRRGATRGAAGDRRADGRRDRAGARKGRSWRDRAPQRPARQMMRGLSLAMCSSSACAAARRGGANRCRRDSAGGHGLDRRAGRCVRHAGQRSAADAAFVHHRP